MFVCPQRVSTLSPKLHDVATVQSEMIPLPSGTSERESARACVRSELQ